MKLKDFLLDVMEFSTRSVSKMKREKLLFVNGEFQKPSITIRKGDIIEIPIDEEMSDFLSQDLGVELLYEDFDILLMNKPAFMVVHPTKSHFDGTLANHVINYIEKSGESYKIRFVNRLDMNTSGIVVLAKNAYAHHILSKDMGDNLVKKEYIAIVDGVMEDDEGTIDLPIMRESMESILRVVDEKGQRSITHYRVIERMNNATVVGLLLETGRTHQIRVHLSSIGHGIIGDELYGKVDESLINRQALHACRISLNQPRMKNRIEIKSQLPDDMKLLIEKLGGKSIDY
nr:RluA family pseudouridine synthase [uncultured Peptostreptococcus sp.]